MISNFETWNQLKEAKQGDSLHPQNRSSIQLPCCRNISDAKLIIKAYDPRPKDMRVLLGLEFVQGPTEYWFIPSIWQAMPLVEWEILISEYPSNNISLLLCSRSMEEKRQPNMGYFLENSLATVGLCNEWPEIIDGGLHMLSIPHCLSLQDNHA